MIDKYEEELMNMSQEEMERIANGEDEQEDTTVRPGSKQNDS